MRVGMFDSGVGGLTVLKEFIKKHPKNEYIYYGDTLNAPYGDKTKEELLTLTLRIIKFLESKKVDIIIIACGTTSSNIYNEIKGMTQIPVYNIIDPTIDYIKENLYKNILVLATSRTIDSNVFSSKLENINVIGIKCPLLVPLIEENNLDSVFGVLKNYFDKIELSKIDAIVLGCTHYPIIANLIAKITKDIPLINMGEVIANKINLTETTPSLELNFSKLTSKIEDNVYNILNIVNE